MPVNNTFVIDIDDTLLIYSDSDKPVEERDAEARYDQAKENEEEIKICNKLYKQGYTIILFTGRGWHLYQYTKNQLKEFGIKYHELLMGKPHGTWIDKDFLTTLKDVVV